MRRAIAAGAWLASLIFPLHGIAADFGRVPAGYYRYADLGVAEFRWMVRNPTAPELNLRSQLASFADERAVMNTMVFKVLDNIPNPYPKIVFDERRADGLAGVHLAIQYDIALP